MRKLKKAIYIDALALVPEKKSGIGVTLEKTLEQLVITPELQEYIIYMVVPLGKAKYLKSYERRNVKIKSLILPARGLELLLRTRLLLPIDWFLGTGIYIFPNYRNWPLWSSRSLTYIYDISFILHPETVQPKNQRYLKRYINLWTGRADRVITISHQVSEEIEKHLPVPYTKINVVYCGVDITHYKKSSQAAIQIAKEKYSIPFANYLIYVGNIEPRKNIKSLLKAYLDLPDDISNKYGLVIVGGDGWLNHELQQKIETAGQQGQKILRITDYVPTKDLPALYSGASLLIHPALYEGFGITPLEAMACETPVVVSRLAAIQEVVQDAGYYFDPHDAGELTKTIITALGDKQSHKEHVHEGLLRARDLTWKNTASALYRVIDTEFTRGPHRWPLISRLKSMYQRLDRAARSMLGEKDVIAYQPRQAISKAKLKAMIHDDYLREQPSRLQTLGLTLYLSAKHITARAVKKSYRTIKARKI